MICPHCKANIKVQGKFCPTCGQQVLGKPTGPQPTVPAAEEKPIGRARLPKRLKIAAVILAALVVALSTGLALGWAMRRATAAIRGNGASVFAPAEPVPRHARPGTPEGWADELEWEQTLLADRVEQLEQQASESEAMIGKLKATVYDLSSRVDHLETDVFMLRGQVNQPQAEVDGPWP